MEYYKFDKKSIQYVKTMKPIGFNIMYYIIIIVLCLIVTGCFINMKRQSYCLDNVICKNDELKEYIELLRNECNYENVIKVKIGEYAMHSHRQKSPVTKDSVASLLIEINAWYPEIKMAQIQTESGFNITDVSSNANNFIGMKKTGNRETTQIKGKDYKGYGVYNNWESCIIDMVLWDYAIFGMQKPSMDEYVATLNRIYGSSGNYGNSVNELSVKYRKYFE